MSTYDANSPATSTGAGPSNPKKRKKASMSGGGGGGGPASLHGGDDDSKDKKKGYSCSECHRRKQKCNREFPCQHCIARKVTDKCLPFTPGKPDDDLVPRLARVEKILALQFPQFNAHGALPDFPLPQAVAEMLALSGGRGGGGGHGGSEGTEEDDEMHEEDKDRGRGRLTKGKWFGVSAVQSMSEAPLLGKLQPEASTMDLLQAEHAAIELQLEDTATPAENLQRLITECGVSPTKVAELVQELPPKDFANILVDWFFAKINSSRYPIHEGMFRAAYESLYANGLKTDPSNVRSLPLVFIVLATAVRLSPEHIGGDDRTRRLTSLRYYWSSRRSILIATAIQSESLELVITRLLSSRYLIMVHDRRLTECWSQLGASLRTAQAIGLHRDGTKLGLDAFQTEYRRRIWSYLYHADRTYSLILGRPPAISDVYTDTLPPSNLEDADLVPGVAPDPRPLNEPTAMTYCVLRHSLSRIIGKVTHHFQQLLEPSHYSDVLRLDGEINAFVKGLPPHFAMEHPDKSLDSMLASFLPMHRFYLHTEILFVRITLHRPWLLRKLKSDKFLVSRNACFESAKRDFVIRQAMKKTSTVDIISVMGGQFREFNAAMIAGISAIVDPEGPEGETMRGILATFLQDHPPASAIDDTTKKERSIIETLYQRSVQLLRKDSASGLNPALQGIHDEAAHARTLLGLSSASSRPPSRSASMHSQQSPRKQAMGLPAVGGRVFHPSSSAGPSNQDVYAHGSTSSPASPAGISAPPWLAAPSRASETPPSMEDDSAQHLLDHFWNENLVLDTVVGNQDQIFPSNVQSAASASLWSGGGGGPDHLGPASAGPSSMQPMSGPLAGGLGGGGGGPSLGFGPANNEPADQRYWDSLINSILTQNTPAQAHPHTNGHSGHAHPHGNGGHAHGHHSHNASGGNGGPGGHTTSPLINGENASPGEM